MIRRLGNLLCVLIVPSVFCLGHIEINAEDVSCTALAILEDYDSDNDIKPYSDFRSSIDIAGCSVSVSCYTKRNE